MKSYIIFFLVLVFPRILHAQNSYAITGAVADIALKASLPNATITLLNARDSIIRSFTYATDSGTFKIDHLPTGNFILLITYPQYADYIELFTLDAGHATHNFGNINMQLKSSLLQEVQIKGEPIAVRIKGDTTIYDARAYVIQPNSNVEDLLKQLPDIQVDRNGKITAQGTTVTKVLVDGEEFFGDDPLLVTRIIRGDMVAKVLLYDKKSDQATFTGIDDGVKTKTIDIKLKEDKKNGVFGKITGGIATGEYDEGQAIYNRFKDNEKISAYATTANDGKLGLGYADNNKLGTFGNGVSISDEGAVGVNARVDDLESALGTFNGHGFPVATTAGAHYDNKSADDKETINTNYKVVSLDVTGSQNTLSQLSLPNGVINGTTIRNFDNSAFRQKLDAVYQVKLDPSSTLKITIDGAIKNIQSNTNSTSVNTLGNDVLLNQNTTTLDNKEQQKILNASAFYTKKFKKPGRTFSWYLSEAYNQSNQTGYQFSKTTIYNAGVSKDSLINQYKPINITSSVLNSNMTFSEQLFKTLAVIFNYGFSLNNSSADRESYDQSSPGRYDILDTTYSNNYTFNQLINQLGVVFNYKTKKNLLNFGNKISGVNFKQIDEFTGKVYKRDFLNQTPQASYQYTFTTAKFLILNYNGKTIQPSIDQIQPVKINTDPLNIYTGNPDLKPSFTNRFGLTYHSYASSTGQTLTISGSYTFIANTIASNTATDTQTGISTIQYINLADKNPYNYSLLVELNKKIKSLGINTGVTVSTNSAISYNYINGELDRSTSDIYTATFRVSKSKANKYDFYISGGPTYNVYQMSLQPQSNNNAAGFTSDNQLTYYLPATFQIAADVNYNYNAKTPYFPAQSITRLNAAISKTFFKGNNLKLSFKVNDLLNQNLTVIRSLYGDTNSQTSYTGIKRYFMLTASWDFTKFKVIPVKN